MEVIFDETKATPTDTYRLGMSQLYFLIHTT